MCGIVRVRNIVLTTARVCRARGRREVNGTKKKQKNYGYVAFLNKYTRAVTGAYGNCIFAKKQTAARSVQLK